MNRIVLFFAFLLGCVSMTVAQNKLNDEADNIVGIYASTEGNRFKAEIVKLKDGTYRGQIIWMEHDRDADGNKRLDVKNPDKSLRNTPLDHVVVFSGLVYNAKKHRWDGTKIYDPNRGIRANLTAEFEKDGRLRLKGSLLAISESVYWKKIEE